MISGIIAGKTQSDAAPAVCPAGLGRRGILASDRRLLEVVKLLSCVRKAPLIWPAASLIDGEPLTLIDIHADQQGAVLHTASRTWSRAQMEAKRPVVVEPHRPHGAFIALTGEALCGADMETWDLDDALEELNEGG